MDQTTIGKRIQTLRKQQGLTQEQLAERVGVSPQAVSKWETDNSCPDISILPQLASVLGVSTDELLGAEKPEVKVGEVVSGDGKRGGNDEKKYEFHFDGARSGIWFGIFILTAGILLLLTKTCAAWFPCGFWSLIWPIAIIFAGLAGTCSREISPFSVGITLLGAYFLLSNLKILQYDITWRIVLAAILIIVGVSTILRYVFRKKHRTVHGSRKATRNYEDADGQLHYECSFCDDSQVAGTEKFCSGSADVSFGRYSLDLRGIGTFAENAVLKAEVSFGALTIYLPGCVCLTEDRDNSFGAISVHGTPEANAPYTLRVESDVSFGSLDLRYGD